MNNVTFRFPHEDNYFINEAFNALSINLRFSGPDRKVITMTSCFENEGKSFTVLQLARHLCQDGKRVLVIDADMRKSRMASKYTDLSGIKGLSEVLSEMATLDEALYHVENVPGMDVIFSGDYPPNPCVLLGNHRFHDLIAQFREQYDYVLIDNAPLVPVVDAMLCAKISDGVVLIVNRGSVRQKVLRSVCGQIEKSGAELIGVILNDNGKKKSPFRRKRKPKNGYYSYGKSAKDSK
ncbi:MAG: CpsD/CapB family tyrosine-protein kinase [Clostridia bacterium]|nr:CpsD/CapB family tyrosine-protein kinase [Clostridia bacterium]